MTKSTGNCKNCVENTVPINNLSSSYPTKTTWKLVLENVSLIDDIMCLAQLLQLQRGQGIVQNNEAVDSKDLRRVRSVEVLGSSERLLAQGHQT